MGHVSHPRAAKAQVKRGWDVGPPLYIPLSRRDVVAEGNPVADANATTKVPNYCMAWTRKPNQQADSGTADTPAGREHHQHGDDG